MKRFYCAVVLLCFTFSGCASYKCQKPIAGASKIIISIDTSTALIQDQSLQGNYLESLKSTIKVSAKNKIEKHFSETINNNSLVLVEGVDCAANAIMVYGKLLSINSGSVKKYPRRIYGAMRGVIFSCSNDTPLADEIIKARNDSFMETPAELGEELGKLAIRHISSCK
jgi:hypothetical protein